MQNSIKTTATNLLQYRNKTIKANIGKLQVNAQINKKERA